MQAVVLPGVQKPGQVITKGGARTSRIRNSNCDTKEAKGDINSSLNSRCRDRKVVSVR